MQGRVIRNLSRDLFWAADFSAQQAEAVEREALANDEKRNEAVDKVRSFVISTVICSAAGLEAFVNEHILKGLWEVDEQKWKAVRYPPVLQKYQSALRRERKN